jgi:hypothetical protein
MVIVVAVFLYPIVLTATALIYKSYLNCHRLISLQPCYNKRKSLNNLAMMYSVVAAAFLCSSSPNLTRLTLLSSPNALQFICNFVEGDCKSD